MDSRTKSIIDMSHPDIRWITTETVAEIDCKLTGRAKFTLTSGGRTFKEQQNLYNLGRTVVNPDGKSAKKPMGNIVTKALPGASIHNYFLAVDGALIIDGKTLSWDFVKDWDNDATSDWDEVVKVFNNHGWEAGINWKSFPDAPHFQYDFNYSYQQLNARYLAGDFIPGTNYVNLKRDVLPVNSYRTTASVNFRTLASTSGLIISVILKGEHISEISRSNGWSRITYNGREGYVSTQYLTK